jgi:hypothetical protein
MHLIFKVFRVRVVHHSKRKYDMLNARKVTRVTHLVVKNNFLTHTRSLNTSRALQSSSYDSFSDAGSRIRETPTNLVG